MGCSLQSEKARSVVNLLFANLGFEGKGARFALLGILPSAPDAAILQREGDAMKALFWLGLLVLALGIASLFVAIPHSEREGLKAGNIDIGVQVRHNERVSPVVSAVLILGGAGMMIAGGRGRGK